MGKIVDLIAEGGEVINRKAEWKWQRDGEKIMTKSGIVGMAVSGIYAVKKTNDIADLLQETKRDIQIAKEHGDKKEIRKARFGRARKVGKHYILPIVGATVSGMMIDKGMAKAAEKTAAMATLAAGYAASFRNYREKVIDEYGAEVDRKFMTTEKIKGRISEVQMADGTKVSETGDENGSITLQVNPSALKILYSRHMTPDIWHDSYALRLATLNAIQNELDVMLITNGHITLNDIRRKFGGPKMDVGIGGVIGRVWDPGNPANPRGGRRTNLRFEEDEDFMHGRKDWCWIFLDVDDEPIVNAIDQKFTEVEMP